MATYAELARRREVRQRRLGQDARDAVVHQALDLMAQDQHVKSERAHFAVVTASSAFRLGYAAIRWEP